VSLKCKNCGREVECESCEPFCICCFDGEDTNPTRGNKCFFPTDCYRLKEAGKKMSEGEWKLSAQNILKFYSLEGGEK